VLEEMNNKEEFKFLFIKRLWNVIHANKELSINSFIREMQLPELNENLFKYCDKSCREILNSSVKSFLDYSRLIFDHNEMIRKSEERYSIPLRIRRETKDVRPSDVEHPFFVLRDCFIEGLVSFTASLFLTANALPFEGMFIIRKAIEMGFIGSFLAIAQTEYIELSKENILNYQFHPLLHAFGKVVWNDLDNLKVQKSFNYEKLHMIYLTEDSKYKAIKFLCRRHAGTYSPQDAVMPKPLLQMDIKCYECGQQAENVVILKKPRPAQLMRFIEKKLGISYDKMRKPYHETSKIAHAEIHEEHHGYSYSKEILMRYLQLVNSSTEVLKDIYRKTWDIIDSATNYNQK